MNRGEPSPAIDIAIVNWNTAEAALQAARAYLGSVGVEPRATIVDNRSSDEERDLLRRELPSGVHLDLAESNLGYGAAANRALAAGSAEFVCVSNSDVLPDLDALAHLVAVADEAGVGMVGPSFGGVADRYHAELPRGPDLLGQIFAGSFMRRPVASPPPGAVLEVGQPSGACFVLSRPAWEEVGGFDDGFFLWFEDVDLAKCLVETGHRNLVVGSARVGHTTAGSFRQIDRPTAQGIRRRSLGRYIEKHHRGLAPVARPLLKIAGQR